MTLDIKRIKGTGKTDFKVYKPKLTLVILKKDYLDANTQKIVITRDSSNNISYTIDKI